MKRLRVTKDGDTVVAALLEQPPCLHCNDTGHTWSSCGGLCQQCQTIHPGRRCAALDAGFYKPGSFEKLQQSTDWDAAAAEGRRLLITGLADAITAADFAKLAEDHHVYAPFPYHGVIAC